MGEECSITKTRLRNKARSARAALAPREAAHFSHSICDSLLGQLNGERTVMLYASKPPEVDTLPLIRRLLEKGIRVVVPIIERDTRTLRLSYLDDPGRLVTSTFSVPEPIGSEIPARIEDIDIIIVPLLAFDRFGHRLGYGAGYYDRFLPLCPGATKIGIAFSCQEIGEVPADETDVPLDRVVTEREVIVCRKATMND